MPPIRRVDSGHPGRVVAPRWAITAMLITVPIALAAWLAQELAGVPVSYLVEDTASLGDLEAYAGAISYVGVMAWVAAASVCLFATLVVGRAAGSSRGFLVRAGLLSGWLAVDDLMEVHERGLAFIGVPETVTYAVYAAVSIAHFVISRHVVVLSQWWLLGVAAAAFAVSILADILVAFPEPTSLWHLAEDVPKLLGLIAWLVYHVDVSAAIVRRSRLRRDLPGRMEEEQRHQSQQYGDAA